MCMGDCLCKFLQLASSQSVARLFPAEKKTTKQQNVDDTIKKKQKTT